MSKISQFMIAFGLLLAACEASDLLIQSQFGLKEVSYTSGWVSGGLMIAAGLAAAQGRRSLRQGGIIIGILIPLALTILFAGSSYKSFSGNGLNMTVALRSGVAFFSLLNLVAIFKVRPHDGIASRGYAVTTPIAKRPPAEQTQPIEVPKRRSEVG